MNVLLDKIGSRSVVLGTAIIFFALVSFDYTKNSETCINNVNQPTPAVAETKMSLQTCDVNLNQVSWVDWIFDFSESGQFHFLNLLELLSRNSR